MKKIKISALIIAILMLTATVISCAPAASNEVNCTISVIAGDKAICDALDCPVKLNNGENPTVLQALEVALQFLGDDYEFDSTNLKRLMHDGVEYAAGIDESGENLWFWNYTANGVEPEKGSPAINVINEGDVIVFTYTSLPVENNEKTEDSEEDEEADTEDAAAEDEAEG